MQNSSEIHSTVCHCTFQDYLFVDFGFLVCLCFLGPATGVLDLSLICFEADALVATGARKVNCLQRAGVGVRSNVQEVLVLTTLVTTRCLI
jgi:hypothetical protein